MLGQVPHLRRVMVPLQLRVNMGQLEELLVAPELIYRLPLAKLVAWLMQQMP